MGKEPPFPGGKTPGILGKSPGKAGRGSQNPQIPRGIQRMIPDFSRDLGIRARSSPGNEESWNDSRAPGFGNSGKVQPRDLGILKRRNHQENRESQIQQSPGIWECWDHHWEFPNLDGHGIWELGIPGRRHHRENREFRAGIGIKTPIPVKSRHCSASSSRIPGRIPGKGRWGGRIPWEGGTGASQGVSLQIREPEIPKKFPPG